MICLDYINLSTIRIHTYFVTFSNKLYTLSSYKTKVTEHNLGKYLSIINVISNLNLRGTHTAAISARTELMAKFLHSEFL